MSHTARSPLVHVVAAALFLVLVATACSGGASSPGGSADATPAGPASSGISAAAATAASLAPAPVATASPVTSPPAQSTATPIPLDPAAAALAGTYRCLSRALYYDNGGGGGTDTCTLLASLSLGADGRWSWETSSGTWHVRPVTAADWAGWGIQPYGGVTQALVLDGLGDGPIEPDGGFVWVIYHDASAAGTVWLKWGRGS